MRYLKSSQYAGFFWVGGITSGAGHAAEPLCFGVKSISDPNHSAHFTSCFKVAHKKRNKNLTQYTGTVHTTCTQPVYTTTKTHETCTHPCQLFHLDRCTPAHCSWWWAGREEGCAHHPRCPLCWSCCSTPRCFHTRQTCQMSLFSFFRTVKCVRPAKTRFKSSNLSRNQKAH